MKWLLLRGLGREKRHWGDFVGRLERTDGCEGVLAMDLPGIGDQLESRAPMKIENHTEDLRRRWLQEKGDEDWGILAMSMGGMIALDWASRYPEDFAGATLLNTSSRGCRGKRLRPSAASVLMRVAFTANLQEREELIFDLTCHAAEKRTEAVKHWVELAEGRPVAKSTFVRQLIAAAGFRLREQIECPILFLASTRDKMVDFHCSEEMAKALGAGFELHPEAGHDLALDDPEWVVQKMTEFRHEILNIG